MVITLVVAASALAEPISVKKDEGDIIDFSHIPSEEGNSVYKDDDVATLRHLTKRSPKWPFDPKTKTKKKLKKFKKFVVKPKKLKKLIKKLPKLKKVKKIKKKLKKKALPKLVKFGVPFGAGLGVGALGGLGASQLPALLGGAGGIPGVATLAALAPGAPFLLLTPNGQLVG